MPPVPPPAPVVVPKLAPGAVPPSRAVTPSDKARARGRPPAPQPVHVPQVATPEADAAAAARAAAETAELEQAAQMAAALRAEQKALAEAEAKAAQERAAAEERARAEAERLRAYREFQHGEARTMAALAGMTVPADADDDDIFAEAEGREAGETPEPAAPSDFDVNECLGTRGGVAASWSLNDAMVEPIVYDADYGYEYRVVTTTDTGDFVVRRYFIFDSDQYAAFTVGLGRPMPDSHFTHCGHNFVLFSTMTWVFYSPPALERALRIHERMANQATPEQEIARLVAGTPGLDGRTLAAFAAQTNVAAVPQAAAQASSASSTKPSLPTPRRR